MHAFPEQIGRRLCELVPDLDVGVVAVSGGADSVALLCGLAELMCGATSSSPPPSGLGGGGRIVVFHMNHRLRGDESDADEAFVRDLCDGFRDKGLPIEFRSVVGDLPAKENLEQAARGERYAHLARIVAEEGATWAATAHTADDQAETVLFRIIRGTGLRGLRGIAESRTLDGGVRLVRPMLRLPRAAGYDYLAAIGQGFRTDSSNADTRFSRNRIRAEVLPLLGEFNPLVAESLAGLADQAEEINALIEGQAASALRAAELPAVGHIRVLSPIRVGELPRHLARELFRQLWRREGWPGDRMRFHEWDTLASLPAEKRSVDLPGGVRAELRTGVIRVGPAADWPRPSRRDKVTHPFETHDQPAEGLPMARPIRRALLSVSDKTGLTELARALTEMGVELISTGGTHRAIAQAGLDVREISDVTGFPEILDGRVKTLHPYIHAGILAKRDDPAHENTLQINGIAPIDLIVCNLYPFEQVTADPACPFEKAIENIDVGGPTMIRAAAKNHAHVAVVTDPSQYGEIIEEMRAHGAAVGDEMRRRLAGTAFARTAVYDSAIADYFAKRTGSGGTSLSLGEGRGSPRPVSTPFADSERATRDSAVTTEFPETVRLELHRHGDKLRYGENPHQPAAVYANSADPSPSIVRAEQLHGKELSFNNYLDADAALTLAREFDEPAAVVIKHTNPCGAATAGTLADAFQLAWDGDSLSAFGGIIGLNRPVDTATAERIADPSRFVECVVAPEFDADALERLRSWKKNVRLLRVGPLTGESSLDYRGIAGGMLIQRRDQGADDPKEWKCVTKTQPTDEQRASLWFAWRAMKHVKSNAIVLARGTQLVGVGAGQMSRVESVRIAARKAEDRSRGSCMASDAFFPFRDGIDLAGESGVAAIVQPGGSQRDDDAIAACDEHGIAMLFTGVRHFRH